MHLIIVYFCLNFLSFNYYIYRYGLKATARDFEIYDANATFEDPLMRAHGWENLLVQLVVSFFEHVINLVNNKLY